MQTTISTHWVPKRGSSDGEYEDAFWPVRSQVRYGREQRFAVADGATESSFSRLWACQLVAAYCATRHAPVVAETIDAFRARVEKAAQDWSRRVRANPLPWYAQEKIQQGSFSSLLGLTLCNGPTSGEGTWHALGIGDTCLFHLRNQRLQQSWPVQRAVDFGYHPALVGTMPLANRQIWEAPAEHLLRGEWKAGDQFCLMSDALARFFLQQVEDGKNAGAVVEQLQRQAESFPDWVDEQRSSSQLQNDDTTLIAIQVGGCR